jgi:hypothetical protein
MDGFMTRFTDNQRLAAASGHPLDPGWCLPLAWRVRICRLANVVNLTGPFDAAQRRVLYSATTCAAITSGAATAQEQKHHTPKNRQASQRRRHNHLPLSGLFQHPDQQPAEQTREHLLCPLECVPDSFVPPLPKHPSERILRIREGLWTPTPGTTTVQRGLHALGARIR